MALPSITVDALSLMGSENPAMQNVKVNARRDEMKLNARKCTQQNLSRRSAINDINSVAKIAEVCGD